MLVLRLFSLACLLSSLALLGIAVVCLADPNFAKGYLIDIFSAPAFFGALILVFILIQVRQRVPAVVAFAATILLGLSLWPQVFPNRPARSDTGPVRLVFANMWIKNRTPEKLLPWIERENPDIVAVIEAGDRGLDSLKPLRQTYPYFARRYDMLIYSRYPLSQPRPRPAGYSLFTVRVKAPSGPFTLAVAHLTRPWPFTAPDDQPAQFRRLAADLLDEKPENMVLVGDFNTTPSAAAMSDFNASMGLTPASAATGTWPAVLPGPFCVGIDNVMAGGNFSLHERKVGPAYGSDHRPVRVDVYPSR